MLTKYMRYQLLNVLIYTLHTLCKSHICTLELQNSLSLSLTPSLSKPHPNLTSQYSYKYSTHQTITETHLLPTPT